MQATIPQYIRMCCDFESIRLLTVILYVDIREDMYEIFSTSIYVCTTIATHCCGFLQTCVVSSLHGCMNL